MKNLSKGIYQPLIFGGLLFILIWSCKKEDPPELPALTTVELTEITGNSTSNLTDLSSNTKYYVRAYATNREGTAYGNQIEFTTKVQFAGGTGTQTDPYLIESPEQLDGVRHNLDKHFRQIADIDLSGYSSGAGSIAGYNLGEIINCYATGKVSGNENAGGLVGENMMWNIEGNIYYSYYDKETTGQDDKGKGIPKTTAEMMQKSTFETWDFTNIWGIDEGDSYPYLRWKAE